MSNISFSEISNKQWEELPAPVRPIKENPYAALIAALQAGKAVSVPYEGETQLKGLRIGIARAARAAQPPFLAEFRVNGKVLAIRKSDSPIPEKREVRHRQKKSE